VAAAFQHLSIGPGDVVTIQLPNWSEFTYVSLAQGAIPGADHPDVAVILNNLVTMMVDDDALNVDFLELDSVSSCLALLATPWPLGDRPYQIPQ
jgi:hypothetical protein